MKAKVDIKEKKLHEFEEKLIVREQVSLNLPETFFYLINIYRLFFLGHCNGYFLVSRSESSING